MRLARGNPAALRGVELIWDGARYFDGGLTSAVSIDAPEACVTSMYVALARYYGYDDARVDAAIDWLLANQLTDGGWNCRTVRFGDQHSSFHTSILALEALAEDRRCDRRRTDIDAAARVGSGVLPRPSPLSVSPRRLRRQPSVHEAVVSATLALRPAPRARSLPEHRPAMSTLR